MTKRRGRGHGHGHGSRRKNKQTMRRRHSHSAHLMRNRSRRHRHRHGSRVRRGGMLAAAAEVSSANKAFKAAKFLAGKKTEYDETLAAMVRNQGGIQKPKSVPTFSPAASGRQLPSGAPGVSNSPTSFSRRPIIGVTNLVTPPSLMAPSSTKHSKKAAALATAARDAASLATAARDAADRINE